MEIIPVELIGERVILLPMEAHHVQELFDAGNNPLLLFFEYTLL